MTRQVRFKDRTNKWWPPRRGYALLHKANPLRLAYFSRYVHDWTSLKVLDVGCGGGYTCEFLARRGADVSGTDISEGTLEAARRHAAGAGLKIDYRLGTPVCIPFASGEMDMVTCLQAMEHIEDVRPTLSEICRVLKPGGRLFFDTVNRTFWSKAAAIWFAEVVFRVIDRGTHDWRLFIKPEETEWRLRESGFGNVELAGLRLKFIPWERGGLPLQVAPRGNKSIVYFGSAVRSAASPL